MPLDLKIKKMPTLLFLQKPGKFTNWKIVGMLIIGLIISSIIWSFSFLYNYAYATISNANAIIILSSGLGIDALDNKTFNDVQEKIKLKNSLPSIDENIRNIFYYGSNSTSSTIKK
jgi:hypothetical protein